MSGSLYIGNVLTLLCDDVLSDYNGRKVVIVTELSGQLAELLHCFDKETSGAGVAWWCSVGYSPTYMP